MLLCLLRLFTPVDKHVLGVIGKENGSLLRPAAKLAATLDPENTVRHSFQPTLSSPA